jgi:hypothetical protein
MTAKHDEHRLLCPDGVHHCVDDFQEIARDQDVREAFEEVGE